MKKNVFLVVMDWNANGERGVEVKAFETKEKALGHFHELVEQEKCDSWIAGSDNAVLDETIDGVFDAYDSMADYETSIKIQEQEIL